MTLDCDGAAELAVAGASARDAGVYTCAAANEVGACATSCRVEVVCDGRGEVRAQDIPTLLAPDLPYSREPMFVKKPRSSDAHEGDTVIIYCEVVGDPKPEVVWLRDFLKPDYYRDASHFRRVGEGPEYRFEIPHAKLDYTGAYSVIAKNCHGEAKAIISLQIYAKGPDMEPPGVSHSNVEVLPNVQSPLRDLRCCDGDSVTFECVVSGTPTPHVHWEKDGKRLAECKEFEPKYNGSRACLTITKVFPDDEGEYSCVASNELGRAITSACLIVDVPEGNTNQLNQQLVRPPALLSAESTPRSTPRCTPIRCASPCAIRTFASPSRTSIKRIPPKFYAYPHNRVVEEGGTARFQCAMAGHPMPWAFWEKDGVLVRPSARISIKEVDDLCTLEIEQVTLDDAGLYRVILENEYGTVEASARLDVVSLRSAARGGVSTYSSSKSRTPYFHRPLTSSIARLDDPCRLQGRIKSPSPATYKWYKNGMELVIDERITTKIANGNVSLEIDSLEMRDGGEYTLVVCNVYGMASSSASIIMDLKNTRVLCHKPEIIKRLPETVQILEGQDLVLTCQTKIYGDYKIMWCRDGVELPDCDTFCYACYENGRMDLVVKDIYLEDSGSYECIISNDFGTCVTTSEVEVIDEKDAPVLLPYYQFDILKTPYPVATYVGNSVSLCAQISYKDVERKEFEVVWTVGLKEISCSDCLYHLEDDGYTFRLNILRVNHEMAGPVTFELRKTVDNFSKTFLKCASHLTIVPSIVIVDQENNSSDTNIKPAKLVEPLKDLKVHRFMPIELKAYIDGYPRPQVRWFKGATEIRPDYNSVRPKYSLVTCEDYSMLLIMRASNDDTGLYKIQVENETGRDEVTVSVCVEGVPDPPMGKPFAKIIKRGAFLSWGAVPYDGHRAVTNYIVEMLMTNIPNATWDIAAEVDHTLFTNISWLENKRVYRFRVRAVNAHGPSAPSEESDPVFIDDDVNEEAALKESDYVNSVDIQQMQEFSNEFEILKVIGRGNYGVVKLVKNSKDQNMAAKIINTTTINNKRTALNEINILNQLCHTKLVQIIAAYENIKSTVIVTEYISGGELFERVSADDFTLTEDDCITFIRQICDGVSYFHNKSIVHLDLKPENILCRSRTSKLIKIIDFGLARVITKNKSLKVAYGTRDFISPEVANFEPIGLSTDMWSVGVITYVLLSGLVPFKGDTWGETLVNISNAVYDYDDESFDDVSDDAKEFIKSLLVKDPDKRLTADECLQHRWITSQATVERNAKVDREKLRKFLIKRRWQKGAMALCALNRLTNVKKRKQLTNTGTPASQSANSFSLDYANNEEGNGHINSLKASSSSG